MYMYMYMYGEMLNHLTELWPYHIFFCLSLLLPWWFISVTLRCPILPFPIQASSLPLPMDTGHSCPTSYIITSSNWKYRSLWSTIDFKQTTTGLICLSIWQFYSPALPRAPPYLSGSSTYYATYWLPLRVPLNRFTGSISTGLKFGLEQVLSLKPPVTRLQMSPDIAFFLTGSMWSTLILASSLAQRLQMSLSITNVSLTP